jgi:hypothetical protein
MKSIRKRLSFANIMSAVAVFIALSGIAVAAGLPKNSVGKKQLKSNAVTTAKIKKNAVTAKKIKKNAVTGAKIAGGAVTTAKLGAKAVTGANIADGTITGANVANESLTTEKISDVAVKGATRVAATSAGSVEAARAAAPAIPLLASGPLSVYAKCFTDTTGPTTYAEVYAGSSVAGAIFVGNSDSLEGEPFLNPATPEDERQIYTNSVSANSASGWRTIYQLAAPGGASLAGEVALYAKNGTLSEGDGVYGGGDACLFSGFATS